MKNPLKIFAGFWTWKGWAWVGWNAFGAITQLLLAIAAFTTIVYTLNKDSEFKEENLLITYDFTTDFSYNEEDSMVYAPCFVVNIVNKGLSTVYIERSGIYFNDYVEFRSKPIGYFSKQYFIELKPGQATSQYIDNINKVIESYNSNSIKANDILVAFAQTTISNNEFTCPSEYTFATFKLEYDKLLNIAKEETDKYYKEERAYNLSLFMRQSSSLIDSSNEGGTITSIE